MIKFILKFLLTIYNAVMVVVLALLMVINHVFIKSRWTKVELSEVLSEENIHRRRRR